MHAEAIKFLFADTCKIVIYLKRYLKTGFEFSNQQGCVNNFYKLRNE